MNSEPASPKVEDFSKLDAFLRAYFQFKKTIRPGWSLHVWARSIGLRSGSLLSKVLRQERALSDDLLIRLAVSFEPNENEVQHWIRLHLSEKTETLKNKIESGVQERRARPRARPGQQRHSP